MKEYETSECEYCELPIWRYCHSQAGTLKAYAWTTIDPDGEDDPRYGVTCDEQDNAWARHAPC